MINCIHINAWLICDLKEGDVFECVCSLIEDEECDKKEKEDDI